MRRTLLLVVTAVVSLSACSIRAEDTGPLPTSELATISVRSTAFEEGARIPERHTCVGEDVAPPLTWTGVPADARRVAVVVDDPDAPGGTFLHWFVLLGPEATSVPEDVGGYRGPCPPPGKTHHYRFSVFALGTDSPVDAAGVRKAAIASGTLTATFSR